MLTRRARGTRVAQASSGGAGLHEKRQTRREAGTQSHGSGRAPDSRATEWRRAITATVVRAVGVAVVGITAFTLLVFTSPVWAATTYYATSCADLSKIY